MHARPETGLQANENWKVYNNGARSRLQMPLDSSQAKRLAEAEPSSSGEAQVKIFKPVTVKREGLE
jgi:hypothetical protein